MAMQKQAFSRNDKVIPKREKIHPALKEAVESFKRYHGHPSKSGKRKVK